MFKRLREILCCIDPITVLYPSDQTSNITKVKLKDDATPSTPGGLKRSHSSPNIAKMLQDGSQRPDRVLPSVDRTSKPNVQ